MTAEEKLRREDFEWLKEQPQFQRLLFEIQRSAGIYQSTREEHHALFLEGKRSLGLEILGWFSAEMAEPFDAIASAINARIISKQGARRDDRDSEPEPE
jgi:hypothetical protein